MTRGKRKGEGNRNADCESLNDHHRGVTAPLSRRQTASRCDTAAITFVVTCLRNDGMTGVSVCNANNGMPVRARMQKSVDRVIMVSSVPNGFPPAPLLCRLYPERDRFGEPLRYLVFKAEGINNKLWKINFLSSRYSIVEFFIAP